MALVSRKGTPISSANACTSNHGDELSLSFDNLWKKEEKQAARRKDQASHSENRAFPIKQSRLTWNRHMSSRHELEMAQTPRSIGQLIMKCS